MGTANGPFYQSPLNAYPVFCAFKAIYAQDKSPGRSSSRSRSRVPGRDIRTDRAERAGKKTLRSSCDRCNQRWEQSRSTVSTACTTTKSRMQVVSPAPRKKFILAAHVGTESPHSSCPPLRPGDEWRATDWALFTQLDCKKLGKTLRRTINGQQTAIGVARRLPNTPYVA